MNAITTTSPKRELRGEIEAMADQFKMALPSHIKVDKFQRVVLTAVMSDPELLHADRRSLIASVTKAAQDGLLPDKREGALVIFNQKVSKKGEQDEWIKAVQWMPMIAGVLKKVRQSGEIAAITANIIHEKDQFIWSLGDDEAIEHVPPQLGEDRGKPIGVYAIATLKDGYKIREVMDINEIEKVRKVSKTGQFGPWKDWWEEMAKKTVIRRLSKRLPMSTDIEGVINDEATEADFSKSTIAALGPSRMTREALANHATDPDQPSTSSPDTDDAAETSGAPVGQMEATGTDDDEGDDVPAWQAQVDDWKERIARAGVVGTIIGIRGELKPHVDVLPSDVATELYRLLDDAAAKFTTKGN
jgi:recombination protein RecT